MTDETFGELLDEWLDVPSWTWDRALEELGVTAAAEFERALATGLVELWHPRDVIVMSADADAPWDHYREIRVKQPGHRTTIAWVPTSEARDYRIVPRGRLAVGLRATA